MSRYYLISVSLFTLHISLQTLNSSIPSSPKHPKGWREGLGTHSAAGDHLPHQHLLTTSPGLAWFQLWVHFIVDAPRNPAEQVSFVVFHLIDETKIKKQKQKTSRWRSCRVQVWKSHSNSVSKAFAVSKGHARILLLSASPVQKALSRTMLVFRNMWELNRTDHHLENFSWVYWESKRKKKSLGITTHRGISQGWKLRVSSLPPVLHAPLLTSVSSCLFTHLLSLVTIIAPSCSEHRTFNPEKGTSQAGLLISHLEVLLWALHGETNSWGLCKHSVNRMGWSYQASLGSSSTW